MFLSMRLDNFMKKVRDITGGSSVPTMSQEKLKELTFSATSIEEEKEIGKLFLEIDKLITLHQHKFSVSKKLMPSLIKNASLDLHPCSPILE